MTILEANLKDIERLVGKAFYIEEIEEILFAYGMELENYNGDELFIDITPDRPDMLSKYGLARALKKYLGINKGITQHNAQETDVEIDADPNLATIRPYIAAAIVKNLDIDDEVIKDIIWVQEKLHATFCRNRKISAIGIYPFHKISPPIRYYAEDPDKILFRPLGYNIEMNGYEILKEHETGQKYGFLLGGVNKYPLLIDSEAQVLSMPPLINSEDVGRVEAGTSDIFIEVTGTNFTRVHQVINILSAMFADMGGMLYTTTVRYEDKTDVTPNTKPVEQILNVKSTESLLGLKLQQKEIMDLLEKMGYGIKSSNEVSIRVLVPYYRTDILHEVDIIDDIARAYELNNLVPELPEVDTVGEVLKKTRVTNFLRDALISLGFTECFTLALSNVQYQYTNMNMHLELEEMIPLANSKTSEMNIVRTWLIPELIRCIKANESHSLPVKLFEISDVCVRDNNTDTGYKNVTKLAVLIADSKVTFTDIKQVFDFVMQISGINYDLGYCKHDSFIEGRVGNIIFSKDEIIGLIGELHPSVLKNWQWKYPIACMEMSLDFLVRGAEHAYERKR